MVHQKKQGYSEAQYHIFQTNILIKAIWITRFVQCISWVICIFNLDKFEIYLKFFRIERFRWLDLLFYIHNILNLYLKQSTSDKANPIKPCKTGNSRSNFQKPGTFGNLKILSFQNHYFLLDQLIFGDFMAILEKETVIFWV